MTTIEGNLNVKEHPNETTLYGTGNITLDGSILINGSGTAGRYTTLSSQQLSDVLLTLPITSTLSDTILARQSSDTLTNKIITASSNTVYAKGLSNATTDVIISASAAPSADQVLMASNSTTAAWATMTIDQVTPTTTKGDIIVENGTNAVRLAVGSSGQVLTVDSTTETGLKWAAAGASITFVDWTTWTPTNVSNITTLTNTESRYTRLGNNVTLTFDLTITPAASSDSIIVGGLPLNITKFTAGTKLSNTMLVRSVSDNSINFGQIVLDRASDTLIRMYLSNWTGGEPYYVRGQINYAVG
jgi:hypothetical protein